MASDLLDEASYQINSFGNQILDNEFGYIWEHQKDPTYNKDFRGVVNRSLQESKTLIEFYSASNWIPRLLVLVLGLLFYFLMRHNIRKIKKLSEAPVVVLAKANHIPRHLLAATFVFGLMLIPFIYNAAPQAFTQTLWFMQVIAMVVLIRKKLNFSLGLQILFLLILFCIVSFANLLIETTYVERWIQLFVSLLSVFLGCWMWVDKTENHFSKAAFYKPLIALFVVMNLAAFLLNVTGRFTIAKVLNTGANYGMIEALNLLIFVEIIIDALYLTLEANKKSSRLTAFFEFKGMEMKMRKALGFFASLVWLVVFAQNIHVYDAIFGNISEILFKVRTIGSLEFTLKSIVIFLIIIWLSTLVAQMVSFISSGTNEVKGNTGKSKLGSTILLVRLGIYCAGALLAFGASGIPLNKLALVIGALGVGIGFGLQNIVNNLVSGVVLAFEKPVQIGDSVEIGKLSGIVKEVGIRSSKLIAYDGSEVIIPNGDLLSQHLINWTKNNNNRRIVFEIGIAYGTNVTRVKNLIFELIKNNKNIFTYPEPMILVQNFGDNSVDLKIYIWVDNDVWLIVKSEMLRNIYNTLNEEGINIPYPQRDLHIKSVDENIFKKMQEDQEKKTEGKKP